MNARFPRAPLVAAISFVLALLGFRQRRLQIAAGVAEIALHSISLAAPRQGLRFEVPGAVQPAQTDRFGPVTGRRDDVPGAESRRPSPEIIECGGAARLDLCRCRCNAEKRRCEQRRPEVKAVHFSVITIRAPVSPTARR
jgi:hypothetical protein